MVKQQLGFEEKNSQGLKGGEGDQGLTGMTVRERMLGGKRE